MGRFDRPPDESELSDGDTVELKRETSTDNDLAHGMSSTRVGAIKDEPLSRSTTPLSVPTKLKTNPSSSASTPRAKSEAEDSAVKVEHDITNGHNSPNMEQPVRPKKGVRSSKKNPARVAPLFDDLPDATEQANSAYTVIDSCTYQNKYLGYTEHAMECDCAEEWGESYHGYVNAIQRAVILTMVYRFGDEIESCLW